MLKRDQLDVDKIQTKLLYGAHLIRLATESLKNIYKSDN